MPVEGSRIFSNFLVRNEAQDTWLLVSYILVLMSRHYLKLNENHSYCTSIFVIFMIVTHHVGFMFRFFSRDFISEKIKY